MDREISQYFRDQLRAARTLILKDSEAYEEVVLVLERMGRFLCPNARGLGNFRTALEEIAHESPLADDLPRSWPEYHFGFGSLFELVLEGRNTAVHEGALARHLTAHAIELALLLEDALMKDSNTVAEYMVRSPATAMLWQPLSFIRQTMLANSFSFLPVRVRSDGNGQWSLISDKAIAGYLRSVNTQGERGTRLGEQLQAAVAGEKLQLTSAKCVPADMPIRDLIQDLDEIPVLVVSRTSEELLGILTPFDLL